MTIRTLHPRGGIYVLTLGLALIVTTIGLGALAAVRAQSRSTAAASDAAEARLYALSAIELGRQIVAQDASWRTTYTNGDWLTDLPIGQGTLTLRGENPNGPLNNSPTDPLLLTGTGTKGQATQRIQVTLAPAGQPLNCLNVSLVSGSTLTITGSTVQSAGQTIASNASVSVPLTSAVIYPNVEAVGTIGTATTATCFKGTKTPGLPARQLPATGVFDEYTPLGVVISPPLNGLNYEIKNVTLSPTANPFGATNPNGVYVVDCQGKGLVISGSSINATLVVRNATGPSVVVQGSDHWTPATPNYPCLLVQGSLNLYLSDVLLSGATSEIAGLVYVSKNISVMQKPKVGLLLAGGTITVNSTAVLTLSYSSLYRDNPPPGFGAGPLQVQPGSWRQALP